MNLDNKYLALLALIVAAIVGACGGDASGQPAIKFDCPHCGGRLSTDLPWVCGYCGGEHRAPDRCWGRSFLTRCRRCGSAPRAFRCIHCENPVRLQAGGDERGIAWSPFSLVDRKTEEPIEEPPPAPVIDPTIAAMLKGVQGRQARREALLRYEKERRQQIEQSTELTDKEKAMLLDELASDVEQARLLDV